MSLGSASFNIQAIISAVDRASATFKKVADNAATAGDRFARVGRIAEIAGGFIVANFAFRALDAVQRFVQEAIDAFLAYEDTVDRLRVVATNMGENWAVVGDELINKAKEMGRETVYPMDQIINAMQRLMSYGMSSADVLKYIGTVVDLAEAKQLDLATAADLVGKAFTGHTETLSRYGIILDESSTKTLTLKERFDLLLDSQGRARILTDEQVAALEALGVNLEGVDRKTLTWEEAMRLLTEAINEGKVGGDALNEFLGKYTLTTSEADATTRKFEELMALLSERFRGAASGAETTADRVKMLENQSREAAITIGEKLSPATEAWAGFVLYAHRWVLGWLTALEDFNGWVTTVFVPSIQAAWSAIQGVTQWLHNEIMRIWNAIGSGVNNIWNRYIQPLVDRARAVANAILDAFRRLHAALVGGSVVPEMFEEIEDVAKESMGRLEGVVKTAMPKITAAFPVSVTGGGGVGGGIGSVNMYNTFTVPDEATAIRVSEIIADQLRRLTRQ